MSHTVVQRLQDPQMSAHDLPLDVLALILGEALDGRWHFCARAVCRTWASVCASTSHTASIVRISCVASLLAGAYDSDPQMTTPEAVETWCQSMGASLAQAGAALVASGRRAFVDYAIARPRAHDVVSTSTIPFEPLTVAVVRLCEPNDVKRYLNTHLLARIPDWAVKSPLTSPTDNDHRESARECKRRKKVLAMLQNDYILRFESVHGAGHVAWPDRSIGRAKEIYGIARFMVHDPKLARSLLGAYSRKGEHISTEEAIFLLMALGKKNNSHYWTEQYEALIVDAMGDTTIDPRVVVDLLARCESAIRSRPFETPLLIRLYCESPLLASLRPVRVLDVANCPLLDHEAQVSIGIDIALLELASSSPSGIIMPHATIDMVVSRALANAHYCMCCPSGTASAECAHQLWHLVLRARSAYKVADAAERRTGPRPRHSACSAGRDCAVLAEARRRAVEPGFAGAMWRDLFVNGETALSLKEP